MVAGFWPGIRKEDMHAIKRFGQQHVAYNFYSVMLNNTQIGKLTFFDLVQQTTDTGCGNLNGQVVAFRMPLSNSCRGFTHAGADFKNLGRFPAKNRSEERRVGKEWRSRWSPYH